MSGVWLRTYHCHRPVLLMQVEHFSRYGLAPSDTDEEDDVVPTISGVAKIGEGTEPGSDDMQEGIASHVEQSEAPGRSCD